MVGGCGRIKMTYQTSVRKLDLKLENENYICEAVCESYPSPPPTPKHLNVSSHVFVRFPPGAKISLYDNFKPKSLRKEQVKMKLETSNLPVERRCSTRNSRMVSQSVEKLSKFDMLQDGYATHCYICENRVKPDYLRYHLYFGDLKCEICGKVITSCMKFGSLKLGPRKLESCKHEKLEWVFPPVDSLKRLFDEDEKTFNESLAQYLKSLERLKNIKPFKTAICYCRNYLKEKLNSDINKSLTEIEDDLPGPVITTINTIKTPTTHVIDSTSASQCSTSDGKTKSKKSLRMKKGNSNNCTVPPPTHSLPKTNTSQRLLKSKSASGKEHHKSNCTILTASNSPFNLNTHEGPRNSEFNSEKAEEYANICTDLTAFNTKTIEEFIESKSDSGKGHKKILPVLPENGFYYIATEYINECPNCYESLDPKNMIFMPSNYLISISCTTCALLVIFVSDPPDGSEHMWNIIRVL